MNDKIIKVLKIGGGIILVGLGFAAYIKSKLSEEENEPKEVEKEQTIDVEDYVLTSSQISDYCKQKGYGGNEISLSQLERDFQRDHPDESDKYD